MNAGIAAGGGGIVVVVVVGPADGTVVVEESPGVGIDGPPTGLVVVVVLEVGGGLVVVVAPYATPGARNGGNNKRDDGDTRARESEHLYPIGIRASHLQEAPGTAGPRTPVLGRTVSYVEPGSTANLYPVEARPAIPKPVRRGCSS